MRLSLSPVLSRLASAPSVRPICESISAHLLRRLVPCARVNRTQSTHSISSFRFSSFRSSLELTFRRNSRSCNSASLWGVPVLAIQRRTDGEVCRPCVKFETLIFILAYSLEEVHMSVYRDDALTQTEVVAGRLIRPAATRRRGPRRPLRRGVGRRSPARSGRRSRAAGDSRGPM